MILHADIETFATRNLKACGSYHYFEDPQIEILCMCFAFDDGPVDIWIPHDAFDFPEKLYADTQKLFAKRSGKVYLARQVPRSVRKHIEKGGEVRAHHANFERTGLNGLAGQRLDFPHIEAQQTVCTALKCAVAGLPRALEHAAKAAGTHPKDQNGKQDMMAVTKPRKGKEPRYTPFNSPERFLKLYSYCADDVMAERALDHFCPELTADEQRIYLLDQRMNDRGVLTDRGAIADALDLINQHKRVIEQRVMELTGYMPTQREKIFNWIAKRHYVMHDMKAPTVVLAQKDEKCPTMIREVLLLYSIYGMKAVSKYTSMQRVRCMDDCLHGMFLIYGAGTGRWSSLIVQLHNLMRPKIKDTSVAIEAMAARSLPLIRMLYSIDPMIVFASCIRGMLIAHEGRDFMALDFSSVEARIVAWLAGAEDILKIFRGHGKIYEHTAAKIYRKLIDAITEDERFIGKIAVLSLGYQGAVGALMKMAKSFGVDLKLSLAEFIVKEWRASNPKIKRLWRHMNEAAVMAIRFPGKTFAIPDNKLIRFQVESHWLKMRLPSGRILRYFKPEVEEDKSARNPDYRWTIYYYGIDTDSRIYRRCNTYGGKLLQNAAEGIARDLLTAGLFRLEDAGYYPIGSVHDEGLCEPKSKHGSLDEAKRLICTPLRWANGLPVAVSGFREGRFRK